MGYFCTPMARFHPLKVKDIRRETSEAVSIAFEVPPPRLPEYQFKMGQYITLKLRVNGEEIRRSYSLCTAPHEAELRVAVKQVQGGKGSIFINQQLNVGDTVEVMTPMGSFNTPLSGANKKHYVLIAGGSGITPMMSIIKSVLYIEKQSKLTLIYANRNPESAIFKQEIEKLEQQNAALKVFFVYDEQQPGLHDFQHGLLSDKRVTEILKHLDCAMASEYFICGPGPMMENARLALQNMGATKESVHVEYFTTVNEAVEKALNTDGTDVKAHVKVIQYGVETEFELETSGISVLEAAIEAGVDAPFSCKGAVCCTCRAKVLEGKVKMTANYALTDTEVAEGYVLTCQSHPVTETVVIDYDA